MEEANNISEVKLEVGSFYSEDSNPKVKFLLCFNAEEVQNTTEELV
jgi:hypothetical protein